jgi:lambda repressor-like predicted transcriptional regulator
MEVIIAEAIGVAPAVIWPSRYSGDKGTIVRPRARRERVHQV